MAATTSKGAMVAQAKETKGTVARVAIANLRVVLEATTREEEAISSRATETVEQDITLATTTVEPLTHLSSNNNLPDL